MLPATDRTVINSCVDDVLRSADDSYNFVFVAGFARTPNENNSYNSYYILRRSIESENVFCLEKNFTTDIQNKLVTNVILLHSLVCIVIYSLLSL